MGGDFSDRRQAPSLSKVGSSEDLSHLGGRSLPEAPELPDGVAFNNELGVYSFKGIHYFNKEMAVEAASIEDRVESIHDILPVNIPAESAHEVMSENSFQHNLTQVEKFFSEVKSLLNDLNNCRERDLWYDKFCENPRCGAAPPNVYPLSVDDLLDRAQKISEDGVEVLFS